MIMCATRAFLLFLSGKVDWNLLEFSVSEKRACWKFKRFQSKTHQFLFIDFFLGWSNFMSVSVRLGSGWSVSQIWAWVLNQLALFNQIKTLVTLTKDKYYRNSGRTNQLGKKFGNSPKQIEFIDLLTLTINFNPFILHGFESIHTLISIFFSIVYILFAPCDINVEFQYLFVKNTLWRRHYMLFFPRNISNWLKFHKQVLNLYPNQVCVVKMNVKKPYIMIRKRNAFEAK